MSNWNAIRKSARALAWHDRGYPEIAAAYAAAAVIAYAGDTDGAEDIYSFVAVAADAADDGTADAAASAASATAASAADDYAADAHVDADASSVWRHHAAAWVARLVAADLLPEWDPEVKP